MSAEIDFTKLDTLVGNSKTILLARKIDMLLTGNDNFVPTYEMLGVDISKESISGHPDSLKVKQILGSLRKYLLTEYGVSLEEKENKIPRYKSYRYPLALYGSYTLNRNPLAKHKQITQKIPLDEAKLTLSKTSGFLPKPLRDSLFKGTEILVSKTHFIDIENSLLLSGIKWFPEIFDAIQNKKILYVTYLKRFKYETVDQLHPQFLKHYNRRWYVCGRTVTTDNSGQPTVKDNVILALDRIKDVDEAIDSSGYVSVPEDHFSTFFDDIIGVTHPKNSPLRNVTLKVYSEYIFNLISTKKLHHSQKERVIGNERLITFRVRINKELITNILSFGSDVEVITPKSLRISIETETKKMFDRYH